MKSKFVIVSLLVIAVVVACNFILIVRGGRTSEEYELMLETSDRMNAQLGECQNMLLKTFEKLEGDDSRYYAAQYKKIYDSCHDIYSGIEAEIAGMEPLRELSAELKDVLWQSLATNVSFSDTVAHCAYSILYSKGTPLEMSCYENALAELFGDMRKTEARYKDISTKMIEASRYDCIFAANNKQKKRARNSGSALNVGIILIDALRADMLRVNGAETTVMPFLDQLAREGVAYTDATSPSSTTITSVTSIFSGTDPYEANSMGSRQWNSDLSLVREFSRAGRHTAAFTANSLITPRTEFDKGFDSFYARYWPSANIIYNEFRFHWYRHRSEKPFFFYVHIIDPHDPYFSPDSVEKLATEGRPAGFIVDPNDIRARYISKGIDPLDHLKPGNIAYLRELYAQEARYADRWVKNIVDLMREYGMLDNTLLVITADHGEEFLEHGDIKHSRQLYQELVHVPLVVWGKLPEKLSPGTIIGAPHSTLEIFPSLLAAAGIDVPERVAGRVGLFAPGAPVITATKNGLDLDDKSISGHELAALRNGNYKIIVDFDTGKFRLYNLVRDPMEKNDLSGIEPEKAAAMKKELIGVRRESLKKNMKRGDAPSEEIKGMLKSLGYLK